VASPPKGTRPKLAVLAEQIAGQQMALPPLKALLRRIVCVEWPLVDGAPGWTTKWEVTPS
jgi:hypothetical protein